MTERIDYTQDPTFQAVCHHIESLREWDDPDESYTISSHEAPFEVPISGIGGFYLGRGRFLGEIDTQWDDSEFPGGIPVLESEDCETGEMHQLLGWDCFWGPGTDDVDKSVVYSLAEYLKAREVQRAEDARYWAAMSDDDKRRFGLIE